MSFPQQAFPETVPPKDLSKDCFLLLIFSQLMLLIPTMKCEENLGP